MMMTTPRHSWSTKAMRYERLELDLSTAACAELVACMYRGGWHSCGPELENLRNELEARLQRRDQDPKATQGASPKTDWLDE